MVQFLTPPGGALDLVERWIAEPALRDLVEMDGGTWPTGTLKEQLAYLEEFSQRWDRRKGDLRLVFHNGDESRTDERAQRIYSAARALGMLNPAPPALAEVDFVLILGGLATGVEPRVRYTAELVQSGIVACDHVVGLGSYRPVDERERAAADRYAPDAAHELDLLAAMISKAFGIPNSWESTVSGDPDLSPRETETRLDGGTVPRLTVLASRSGEPDKRPANTADTYRQFASALFTECSSTVLAVTSSIYLPYQHMDAVRTLGAAGRLTIETVGVPGQSATPSHPPGGYLQEVRSTLRSAHGLAVSIRQPDPRIGD